MLSLEFSFPIYLKIEIHLYVTSKETCPSNIREPRNKFFKICDCSSLTKRGIYTKSWPPAMPRTLLKVFGGWWVVGGGLESEFSVHLWSKALA